MRGVCLRPCCRICAENLASPAGGTSIMHADTIRDRLLPQDADTFGLVVITTGGNDLIHDYGRSPPREGAMYGATAEQARPWIDNFRQRLEEMISLFEARFPGGCAIFLADIYDPSDGVGGPANVSLPRWPDFLAVLAAYNAQSTTRRHATSPSTSCRYMRSSWATASIARSPGGAPSPGRSALLVRLELRRPERPRPRRYPPPVS